MPSAIYDSVKQSIAEYGNLIKKNEKVEDRLIFRWKLITLALSIIFIVCLGIFSQLLRTVNELPDVTTDKSYILPLLKGVASQTVPAITQVGQVDNLIKGISQNAQSQGVYFQWNQADLIVNYGSQQLVNLNMSDLQFKLQGRSQLVFILASSSNNNFGFYVNHQYSSNSQSVFDDTNSRYSSFFNLNSPNILSYTGGNCTLYFSDNQSLQLFQAFKIDTSTTPTSYSFQIDLGTEQRCYGSDPYATLGSLVGLAIAPPPTARTAIDLASLQVYSLYLNEDI